MAIDIAAPFPTSVGVSRCTVKTQLAALAVPHVRGGEPSARPPPHGRPNRSPRPWG